MSKPIPSPGDNLAEQANTIHKEIVEHLLDTYGSDQGVAVMLAAAMACRTFLDARRTMAKYGDLEPRTYTSEIVLCMDIIYNGEAPPAAAAAETPVEVMN